MNVKWYQVKTCPHCDVVLEYRDYRGKEKGWLWVADTSCCTPTYGGLCQACGGKVIFDDSLEAEPALWEWTFWPFVGMWKLKRNMPPEAVAELINRRNG